jgi:hypothetical protein
MALGSTQPLTEMSTRNISWGVTAAGALGWQSYHLHVSILKSGSLNLLDPSGPAQACTGIALRLLLISHFVTVSSPRKPDVGVTSYRVLCVSVRTRSSEGDRPCRRGIVVQNVTKLICEKSSRITLLVINNTSDRRVLVSRLQFLQ